MSSSEPKLLLIETSGTIGRVGLGHDTTLLAEATLDRSRRNARDLMPEVARLTQEQQWKPSDYDAIAVSIGPGSYTGLRVGMMTAKTLAYTLQKPLICIPTFEVIALHSLEMHQQVEVVGDAQQDRVYVQRFGHGLQPITELIIVTGSQWRETITPDFVLTGPGLVVQQKLLPATAKLVEEDDWQPKLESLLQLAKVRYERKTFADTMTVEPLYLRASSAEEQWAAMGR
jgi:tRNA threonylcarbamoyladenosine biosynthesis protein TsaB